MAINRATYYQAPPPDVSYKGTPAYEYASIFLRNRAQQWDLALKQAANEISDKAVQQKLLVDAYKRRLSDLQDSLDNTNKLIAQVEQGNAKAQFAAEKASTDASLKASAQQQSWAKAGAEQVNVPFGRSVGTSTGTSGAGVVGGKVPSGTSADVQTFELANRGKTLEQLMPALAKETSSGGIIAKGTDVEQTNIRGEIASRAANFRAGELQLSGMSEADAIGQAQAEAINALSKTDPVAAQQVQRYFDAQMIPTPEGAGAGGTSSSYRESVSGAVQRPKYSGLGQMPTETINVAAPETVNPEELRAQRDALQKELAGLTPPTVESTDWITRSREIMAGRFGPVMPAPSFYQRNVAQGLQGATDEQIRQAYETWKQSRSPSVVSGVTPSEPTSGGTPTYEQLPGLKTTPRETVAGSTPASPVVPSMVTTTSTPQTSPATPGVVPATDAAGTVLQTERDRLARSNYPIRQHELDALFPGGVPPEILNRALVPPAVEPVRMPQPVAQTVAAVEPNISFSRTPPSTTVDLGSKQEGPPPAFASPQKEKETPGIGAATYKPQGGITPPAQPGGKVKFDLGEATGTASTYTPSANQPSVMKYYTNRINEAKTLSSDTKALQTAVNSGPGKVAADIFRANAASGQPFLKTYETITMTFAGDPDSMSKAHTVALALDMAANNKTAPPKE